jgi:hypothetical protein
MKTLLKLFLDLAVFSFWLGFLVVGGAVAWAFEVPRWFRWRFMRRRQ